MKLMHEFEAVVGLPPSHVEDQLRAGLPGFACERPGVYSHQGGWWYRGEFHVQPVTGGGTRVLHRVYNVAGPGSRWAVPLANRLFIGFADRTEAQFRQLIAGLH